MKSGIYKIQYPSGKTKYLGLFDNEEEANKKYLETLKEL